MIVDIKVITIKAALYPVTILVAMVKSLNFISTPLYLLILNKLKRYLHS